MNVAFFLKPKSEVTFLYDDMKLSEGLEILRRSRFTVIPVLDREGRYAGSVSQGDFLWYLVRSENSELLPIHQSEARLATVRDVLPESKYSPCRISESIDSMLLRATTQNFVPIVDDFGVFSGIITRQSIMNYFLKQTKIIIEK